VINLGLLSSEFMPHLRYDFSENNPNPIECYYLMSPTGDAAIGWVHNRHAVIAKSFYVKKGPGSQNVLGCLTPTVDHITLLGFQPGQQYHVYWFPTRQNATAEDLPDDYDYESSTGSIPLDLSTHDFRGVYNNFIDTLRSDYAFVITQQPIVKSMTHADEDPLLKKTEWDFALYPNPSTDGAWLRFDDDTPKDVEVYDVLGRRLVQRPSMTDEIHFLDLKDVAKGMVWVRVHFEGTAKTKKLLIH